MVSDRWPTSNSETSSLRLTGTTYFGCARVSSANNDCYLMWAGDSVVAACNLMNILYLLVRTIVVVTFDLSLALHVAWRCESFVLHNSQDTKSFLLTPNSSK